MTASDLPDLAADLPTQPEDVAALRRARRASAMSGREIVDAVRQIGGATAAELRARPVFRGEPFTLITRATSAGESQEASSSAKICSTGTSN